MRLDALVGALDADAAAGLQPLIVTANAGATNTGAVDRLPELAAICRERGLWLHVDGAYGGFSSLTERGRAALTGIELADSVTLDPHKWLYQPIECGCLLIREGHLLPQAFTINPDYLADYKGVEVNFSDLGLQLDTIGSGTQDLAVVQLLRRRCVPRRDRPLDRSRADGRADRARGPAAGTALPGDARNHLLPAQVDGVDDAATLERLNAELVTAFELTGRGLLSSTRLHGTYAIRMCVMNHAGGPDDVNETLRWFAERFAAGATGRRRAQTPQRPARRGAWRLGRRERLRRRHGCRAAPVRRSRRRSDGARGGLGSRADDRRRGDGDQPLAR